MRERYQAFMKFDRFYRADLGPVRETRQQVLDDLENLCRCYGARVIQRFHDPDQSIALHFEIADETKGEGYVHFIRRGA